MQSRGGMGSTPWLSTRATRPRTPEKIAAKQQDGPSETRTRVLIGVSLLIATGVAWYVSAYALRTSSMDMLGGIPILSMADMFSMPTAPGVFSFLLAWVVGMVAMMFPAMIPVTAMYSKLMVKGESRPRLARTVGPPLFLGGYLSVYAALGLALFGGVYAAFMFGGALQWAPYSVYGLSGVLLLAGVWQVTPYKERALSRCITPMSFFLARAKKGLPGAYRMGAEHGLYCVGCCWLYMLVMLAVAAMSMLAMILLSGLIIVEKVFVGGARWFRLGSAALFMVLAVLVAASPSLLTLL